MPPIVSREIRLASRPVGRPTADNLAVAAVTLDSPPLGHVLVRNNYLSIEPCSFCRMRGNRSLLPAFELGAPLEGGAIGTVVESRSDAFKPGDTVLSNYGWREWFMAPADGLRTTDGVGRPLSAYLSMLGLERVCPWACAYLVRLQPERVLLVSGSVGAHGSVASRLAQLRDCHIIGSAGSHALVSFLKDECGFDIAFDYNAGAIFEQLSQLSAPSDVEDDGKLEAALEICMAGSFVARAIPGNGGHGHSQPLPVYFLSRASDAQRPHAAAS